MRKKVYKLSIALMEKQLFVWLCMKTIAVSSSLWAIALFCKKYAKPDQCHLLMDLLAQIDLTFPKKNLHILLPLNR